ncbi:MAG: hypothetical protein GX626_07425 [Spirochaetales bacterium]|nr:hypothetical protein [Spirochaetales bacterium]
MKRSVFVILLGVLVLAGCATPKTNPDGSPYWTTHTPKSTRSVHYEVGSAKQSTPQLSQLRAESAAKDAIGRWASTNVDNALVTFIEESGEVLRTKQMLEVLQNLSVQTVNIGLRGVTFVERYTAADGTVWVLASYPVKNLKDAYKQQAAELQQKMALAQAQAEAQALQAEAMLAFLEAQLESGIEE